MNEITKLIDQINGDIQGPTEELLPLVYDELRRLAANRMNDERTDHTLTPTALVHEAYLRLVGHTRGPDWSGRGHFFAAAAEAMRRILIDHARSKNAIKRGGGAKRLDLVESWLISNPQANGLIELDEALSALEAVDSEAAMLVKLRFFCWHDQRTSCGESSTFAPQSKHVVGLCPKLA